MWEVSITRTAVENVGFSFMMTIISLISHNPAIIRRIYWEVKHFGLNFSARGRIIIKSCLKTGIPKIFLKSRMGMNTNQFSHKWNKLFQLLHIHWNVLTANPAHFLHRLCDQDHCVVAIVINQSHQYWHIKITLHCKNYWMKQKK